jgi:type I restriction enzyme S subunit
MNERWVTARLRSLARLRSGYAFKSSQWQADGVSVVKIGNVKQGYLDLTGCSFVSKEDAAASGFTLTSGDILIGLTGYVGEVARVRSNQPLVLNQRVGKFFPTSHCHPDFLYFLTTNADFKQLVVSASHGSAQANVSPSAIEDFEIVVPPLPEQKAIAAILSSLDDKIELNRQMNQTLEAMARAVFLDWFVDFGPTRRKAAGITDPAAILGGLIPNHTQSAPFAALFPDSFGANGLPMGWEEKPLDEVAEFLNGLALQKFPAKVGEPSLPVIKIAELRNGVSAKSDRASRDLADKYIIQNGDFIFSWSGSLMAKFWTEGEGALNQHLFKVSSETYPKWFYSLWVHHHLEEFQRIAASKATTMGHIQRSHLRAAITVDPQGPILDAMGAIIGPLVNITIQNDLENQTLAATRDLLLPKLMSGELRLQEASNI